MSDPTKDQIAAVMLLHGTPEQQAEALAYCKAPIVSQPAPQGVAEVIQSMRACKSFDEFTPIIAAIVQERDALRAEKSGPYFGHYQQSLTKIARLDARVAELEGSVARDAARYKFLRHCDAPRLHRLIEVDGFEKFDRVIDAAIASAKEPSHD